MPAFAHSTFPLRRGGHLPSHGHITGRRPVLPTMTAPTPVAPTLRIGHGFDLHRLEPGLPLILGGVTLEHDRGCAGHSDGDAVYHCVVDAILGAMSLPDIGQLFPDTDPRFKDCASHVFMSAAHERMRSSGFKIGNIDVTIILERPKMAPHKVTIRENIARLLNTDLDNVNIKAKTHEKVDAVGENRAVSVHAVALLLQDGPVTSKILANQADAEVHQGESTAVKTGRDVTKQLLKMTRSRVQAIQDTVKSEQVVQETDPLQKLYNSIQARKGMASSKSWTAKLLGKGVKKIGQKVGEEAVEVVIAAMDGDKEDTIKESADLLYHLSVLWASMDVRPKDVWKELERREGVSGLKEKAARQAGGSEMAVGNSVAVG